MKKYQRLLLIVTSLISVGLFLVYRQQYNRLRHVLEVFNFFGTPCNLTHLERSDGTLLEHDWGPQPVWQELVSKSFIFSAFLVERDLVKGIGVRHVSAAAPKLCYVLLEDEGRPVKGKLITSKMVEDLEYIFYVYSCSFTANDKEAYAVSFKTLNRQNDVSVMLVNTLHVKLTFNSTLCVAPSDFSKKSLFESLSFHSLLGVESFVIYHEQNLLYKAVKLLKNLSNTLSMWTTFYSYNLHPDIPKDIASHVVEYDCQLRTKGQTKYSLTLKVNDYVVPSLESAQSIRLPVKQFCLNHVNKNRPIVLQNFEAVDDHSFNKILRVNKFHLNEQIASSNRFASLFDNTCIVHRYEKCDKNVNTKPDFTMKRFSTDLTRSTLVQLFIHDSS